MRPRRRDAVIVGESTRLVPRRIHVDAAGHLQAVERQAEEDKTSAYLEARGKRSMAIMQDQEANWKSMKREKSGRGVKPKKEPGASI